MSGNRPVSERNRVQYEHGRAVNKTKRPQEGTGEGIITPERVLHFRKTGFLVVRDLFPPEQMRRIRSWTEELQRWPEVAGKYMKYFEHSTTQPDTRLLNRVENFVPFHEGFRDLVNDTRLLTSAARLMGDAVVLFKDKINFKLPGGGGFAPHQDAQAGWRHYASVHLTALVSIDRATVRNGCLELAAGHHEQGLIGEEWAPLSDAETNGMCFEPVQTKPGDAVFFDSFTPHRSAPNHTSESRRVLYISYNRRSDGDCRVRYYADKRRNYPPDIEREQGRVYRFRV